MSNFEADIIQAKIGYEFEDPSLLKLAFTHSSYANENKTASNEKLEFLGDSILNFCIAEYLFRRGGGDEGTLSVMRSKIVSEPPLARCVESLDITRHLICGVGEERNNPHKSDAVMADLFEAVVGAIYLDSGRMAEAEKFILHHLSGAISEALCGKKPLKYTFKIIEKKSDRAEELRYHEGGAVKPKAPKVKGAPVPAAAAGQQAPQAIKPQTAKKQKPPVPAAEQKPEADKKQLKKEKKEAKAQQKQAKQKKGGQDKAGPAQNAPGMPQPQQPQQPQPANNDTAAPARYAVKAINDYKSALQNYLQRGKKPKPEYRVTGQSGSAHEPVYTISVYIGGAEYGSGTAGRKKDAEQAAAKEAYGKLGKTD